MTGTELHCQQRAHAPITALEKALPGCLFLFQAVVAARGGLPAAQKLKEEKTQLRTAQTAVDLDSPPRNVTIL